MGLDLTLDPSQESENMTEKPWIFPFFFGNDGVERGVSNHPAYFWWYTTRKGHK